MVSLGASWEDLRTSSGALDPVERALEQAWQVSEESAALRGPRIKLGEPWSQLGGPQSQLGGPQSQLGGPQSQLGGPQSQLEGPQSQLGGPQSQLGQGWAKTQNLEKNQKNRFFFVFLGFSLGFFKFGFFQDIS